MKQNPYEPQSSASSSREGPPREGTLFVLAVIGSSVWMLVGLAIASLGFLPSAAPGFFMAAGLCLILAGLLNLAWVCVSKPAWLRLILTATSIATNALLVAGLATFIANGTIRGQLAVIAPLFVGVPCAFNFLTYLKGRRIDRSSTP